MSYTLEGPSYALFKMMSLLKSNMASKLTSLRAEMVTNTATLAFFSTINSSLAAEILPDIRDNASEDLSSWRPYFVDDEMGILSLDTLPLLCLYPVTSNQDGVTHGGVGNSIHMVGCSIWNHHPRFELVRLASEFYVRAVREIAREQLDLSIAGIAPGGWDTSEAIYLPRLLRDEEKQQIQEVYEAQLIFSVTHKETSAWI